MKKLLFTLCIIATISSCNNNKTDKQPTITSNKMGDSASAKLPTLNFEQQLAAKLLLPDTLAMAAYRTAGCFEGMSNLKDSIYVMIDVEAQKVTGSLKSIHAGKAAPENIFEGRLKNSVITIIRGMKSPATFTILGNNLMVKFEKDSAVLNLCK